VELGGRSYPELSWVQRCAPPPDAESAVASTSRPLKSIGNRIEKHGFRAKTDHDESDGTKRRPHETRTGPG
jgi:hypothetical protein